MRMTQSCWITMSLISVALLLKQWNCKWILDCYQYLTYLMLHLLMNLIIFHVLRRYESVVTKLYSGTQCGLCSMRFSSRQPDLYGDHLDWHYRQNHNGKVPSKKVTHRRWYYGLRVSAHTHTCLQLELTQISTINDVWRYGSPSVKLSSVLLERLVCLYIVPLCFCLH